MPRWKRGPTWSPHQGPSEFGSQKIQWTMPGRGPSTQFDGHFEDRLHEGPSNRRKKVYLFWRILNAPPQNSYLQLSRPVRVTWKDCCKNIRCGSVVLGYQLLARTTTRRRVQMNPRLTICIVKCDYTREEVNDIKWIAQDSERTCGALYLDLRWPSIFGPIDDASCGILGRYIEGAKCKWLKKCWGRIRERRHDMARSFFGLIKLCQKVRAPPEWVRELNAAPYMRFERLWKSRALRDPAWITWIKTNT